MPLPPFWYPVPFCYIRTERATINSDMGPSLTVDVLPATLDEFYSLSEVGSGSGGFSFSWGRGITLTFPTFQDADGDNLISTLFQGNDPDDSRFDTDNDGLSDYYEISEGLNPRLFDSDDDGLNDHDEVVAGTDPLRKDSDGDGLTDLEELQGWLYTFAFEADGTPRETKVYPDAMLPDTDFDGVTDLQEKIYGFNPNVSQEVNILDYELSTRELDSPLVLLPFNENSGASSFEDISGFGYSASCDLLNSTDSCPVSGVDGRYANAISLDGSDYLILSTSAKSISFVDNRPFTLAAWVYWEGGAGTLISKWNAATGNKQELHFDIDSGGALSLVNSGGSSVSSSGAVLPSTWTHVAVSFDGSQAAFVVDGIDSGGGAWSNTPTFSSGDTDSMVLVGAYLGTSGAESFFTGRLDEVALVDRAFSTAEIGMRLKDARYNLNDKYVHPGEDFFYQSVIENLLNSRFAYGLLKTFFSPREAITNWMNKLLPRTFQLKPDNPVVTGVNTAVITDTLHIEDSWTQSGNLNIKQTVTAQIVDQRAESNFASLWLKLNEGVGATKFADSSGSMPPRERGMFGLPDQWGARHPK